MKKELITIAKITRPALPGVLARNRLFSSLDAGLCDNKSLIWVAGPAGSGKTTLVASWLDARKIPCIWYQIDEGDSDSATFFYYLGLAAKKAMPRFHKPLPLLTPEYLPGVSTFTKRYFEELCARLRPRTVRGSHSGKGRFVIVLDNYQDLPPESALHELLAVGLDSVSSEVSIVMISRSEPPARFARLRASGHLSSIGWGELRFTPRETGQFIRANLRNSASLDRLIREAPQPRIPEPAIRSITQLLHEKTDGWIAGLVLMLGSRERPERYLNPETAAPSPFHSSELVSHYFASELFEKTDAGTRDFLLRTAFLPYVSEKTAAEIAGIRQAGALLRSLVSSHFFITRHYGQAVEYRYHSLFREFLLSTAMRRFPARQLKALRQHAVRILRSSGNVEDAARLSIESADWKSLGEILLENTLLFIGQGRSALLREWFSRLPEKALSSDPRLLYRKGMVLLPFDTTKSIGCLEASFALFRGDRDDEGALLCCAALIDAIFMERGDFSCMDRHIAWITRAAGTRLRFPTPEVRIRVVMSMVCALIFRAPQHTGSREWLSLAQDMLDEDLGIDDKINLAANLHLYYIYMGDHQGARRIAAKVRELSSSTALLPRTRIQWCLLEAIQHHLVDISGPDCLSAVGRGISLSEQTGIHLFDFMLLTTGAYAAVSVQDYAALKKLKDKILPLVPRVRFYDTGNYHCMLLCEALAKGDFQTALREAEIVLDITLRTGSPFPLMLSHVGMAEALFETGNGKEAGRHLKLAKRLVRDVPEFQWDIIFLIPEAYHAFRGGREAEGKRLLAKAFRAGRKQAYVNTLYWRPDVMSFLCERALEYDIEPAYAVNLIRQRGLRPPAFSPDKKNGRVHAQDRWPYPVRIKTLGGFNLLTEGFPPDVRSKREQKPLTLLKALIAFGAGGVPAETLSHAVWPDAEGDKAQQSFKFTLFALRKLLGLDEAVQIKNGLVSLNSQSCSLDVWSFERVADRIEEASRAPGNRVEELKLLIEEAFGLYQGSFLATDHPFPWAVPLREKLRSRFARVVALACAGLELAKEPARAAEICRRALETDCLQEEFYERLMRYYLKLGRRADALSVFTRCKLVLESTLGAEPSESILALKAGIQRS